MNQRLIKLYIKVGKSKDKVSQNMLLFNSKYILILIIRLNKVTKNYRCIVFNLAGIRN